MRRQKSKKIERWGDRRLAGEIEVRKTYKKSMDLKGAFVEK
jgi:hypothetical protein